MFTVDQVVTEHYPALWNSKLFNPVIRPFLQKILHEQAFNDFTAQYPYLKGIEFVEQVLDFFYFSYSVSDTDLSNIPSAGKVVIIANHPLGSLDGIALLKLIHSVRSDFKIVANDLLMAIPSLRPFLLPVKNMTGVSTKKNITNILQALKNEEAVIIFPSGEVSRMNPKGISDKAWQSGFLKIAEKTKAPILPVHISGRNSAMFYFTSTLIKPLSTLILVNEMFKQQKKQLRFRVGSIIPYASHSQVNIRQKDKIKLFKKHLYRIGAGKRGIFPTETSIAAPERKADMKNELKSRTPLGTTPDGKIIYLFEENESSPVLREIGRLREITFRAVGEGSGKRRDNDRFDRYYKHLVLWDEDDLEIAGAYRFADAENIIKTKGTAGIYSASLFELNQKEWYFLENSLELGRSFVQQKYWGKRSLDYLWFGIGAYLAANPQYRYLFGPVTVSNTMPLLAKELLIYFYILYFGPSTQQPLSITPFSFSEPVSNLSYHFSGKDYKNDFKKLKSLLTNMGTNIPPLYKQYTELCEQGGVVFLDFNVDPNFKNCIDGLVVVDTHKFKKNKKQRYLSPPFIKPNNTTQQ